MSNKTNIPVFVMVIVAVMSMLGFCASVIIACRGIFYGYILASLCAIAAVFWSFQSVQKYKK